MNTLFFVFLELEAEILEVEDDLTDDDTNDGPQSP